MLFRSNGLHDILDSDSHGFEGIECVRNPPALLIGEDQPVRILSAEQQIPVQEIGNQFLLYIQGDAFSAAAGA